MTVTTTRRPKTLILRCEGIVVGETRRRAPGRARSDMGEARSLSCNRSSRLKRAGYIQCMAQHKASVPSLEGLNLARFGIGIGYLGAVGGQLKGRGKMRRRSEYIGCRMAPELLLSCIRVLVISCRRRASYSGGGGVWSYGALARRIKNGAPWR